MFNARPCTSPSACSSQLSALTALAGCFPGNAASSLAKTPEYAPRGETKCAVSKSHERPLVVEWPSSDRLELETRAREGVVAVRYVGCEMSVLDRCSVPARYRYVGATRKEDELDIRDDDDLYANLPVGAAKLEAKLRRSGKLTVKMQLVGRYQAEKTSVRADELQGDCAGATHFIYGVTLGAFDFSAGGDAEVGGGLTVGGAGGGARSRAAVETISRDGDAAACASAGPEDKAPPAQCGALIRVEVVPLVAALVSVSPAGAVTARDTVTTAAPSESPPPDARPYAGEMAGASGYIKGLNAGTLGGTVPFEVDAGCGSPAPACSSARSSSTARWSGSRTRCPGTTSSSARSPTSTSCRAPSSIRTSPSAPAWGSLRWAATAPRTRPRPRARS